MTLNINISINAEVDPQEIKTIVKMVKKLGMTELLQSAVQTAAPAPAAEPELPTGTFVGGEELHVEEPTPISPAPKREKKPKAILGFR